MTFQIVSRCLLGTWKLSQSFLGILVLSLVFDWYSFLDWGVLQVDRPDWDKKPTLLRRYHSFSDPIPGWRNQTLKTWKDGISGGWAINWQEFLCFECLVYKCSDLRATVLMALSSLTLFRKNCDQLGYSGTKMSDADYWLYFHILY